MGGRRLGWGGVGGLNGQAHIIGPNGRFGGFGAATPHGTVLTDIQTRASHVVTPDKTFDVSLLDYIISCKTPDSVRGKLQVGSYEIHGNYLYQSWREQPNKAVNWPTMFEILVQGKVYKYNFGVATQRRSPIYETILGGQHPAGMMDLLLGTVQVTQDQKNGRYLLVWQPTSELAAVEIK